MINKITHLLKYGVIGALMGGILKIVSNLESPSIPLTPIIIWGSSGAFVAMLFSLVVEKWFNTTTHD